MLFNSFEFIFFFIGTVIIYYILPHKYRWVWLLTVSYYFYYSYEPKLTLLLFASTLIDYFCGIKIFNSKRTLERKIYLAISIVVNISLLIFFKYLGFFTETTLQIIRFFGIDVPNVENIHSTREFSHILIPIGISFYTFQTLSYSIEIYRKHIQPERHFGRYALYVSFFPQLVAGPIERAQSFLPQLKNKVKLDHDSIRIGLMLMAWGFFMKMVVADRLGIYVDKVFEKPWEYAGEPLLIGAYFFTFQIYFDFAAYSIIAIGAARVIGFNLMANFNRPIYCKNAQDFWSRWHISFMTWLRDYLYRPLVKNLHLKRALALFIIFAISGLWHGAGWNFIIWGTINGLFLIFEIATNKFRKKIIKQFLGFLHPAIPRITWQLICFHFVMFSLVFFRTATLKDAYIYFYYLPRINSLQKPVLDTNFELILTFLFIVIVQTVHYFKPDHKIYELIINRKSLFRWTVYIVFIIVIVFFTAVRRDPFIYFQF